jgi:hypothetical protein
MDEFLRLYIPMRLLPHKTALASTPEHLNSLIQVRAILLSGSLVIKLTGNPKFASENFRFFYQNQTFIKIDLFRDSGN